MPVTTMRNRRSSDSGVESAAAPEERTSGDDTVDHVVKKRKVRRSGKEESEEGAAAAARLDGLQQMAGDNSDADAMRKRKSRKSGKRASSELKESGVLMEATEGMMAEKSEEGGKPKLENHSVSNGDAVDGVGGSCVPEEFRVNYVVMAEKGEGGSAIKAAAAALLEEQTFGDGTRAKEKKVRKSGKGVSRKSVVSAEAIQVVMADKSEEGAAAAPLDGPEQHARADVVKKKKVRKTVKEVGSVPPQATDVAIGEKSEEGTAAALLDGTGHRSSKHAKVRKSGKGVISVLEVVGVSLQAADVVTADKGEEGVGEHLGADVLQKRKVSKNVKAVRTKIELGVSSEASKVVEAKKGEEGAGPSERRQRTAEDHSVVDGVKKTKSGKRGKGTSSVPEATACVSLRVTNVTMEGKGEVAAGPSDGLQPFSRDHLIANAGKKSKSWMSGEGASSTADGSGAPVQASADVGMVEKIECAATLTGLLSHGQMVGDHTGAEVTPKTKGRKRDRVSSTHDGSGEPILEKSEECAATLSGPSSHDRMARAHSGVDVTPKTKGRKCGKGASSISGESGALAETTDVVMAINSEEGGGPLNGSPVSLSVSGQNRKSPKSTKVVSRMADQLEASQQATAVVMAKKSEEGAAPLDGLPALPSAGDRTGANVLEKRKIGKIGLGETSSPQKLNAPPQVVMALPASGSLTEACITRTVGQTRRRRHKKRGSQFNAKLESGTSSIVDSSMDLELLPNSPIDVSDKNLSILPVGSRDGVLRQASDSLLSEDPSLALTKTPDRSSPIRGVVVQHDFASADLLDRQNNQLESLIAEEACFSFQLGSGVTPVNGFTKKKLLVLDLNGILTDIVTDYRDLHKEHKRIGGKTVFKRPFCDDFLKFCFERFDIGIWSSRKMYNVTAVVDYLMADTKHKLLFSWDQSRCTVTRFKTMENSQKPLVLKELKRLWNKEDPDLPWEKGEYSPSNTLLVDDSPYKALCNPPYTAIFPRPFSFDNDNDNSLGPGGDLRVYLDGIAGADDVQQYVKAHPFGHKAITSTHPNWEFYRRVIQSARVRSRWCC